MSLNIINPKGKKKPERNTSESELEELRATQNHDALECEKKFSFQNREHAERMIVALQKKVDSLKKSNAIVVRNFKAVVYQECFSYVRGKSGDLCEKLNKERRKLIHQFLEYKERSKHYKWALESYKV